MITNFISLCIVSGTMVAPKDAAWQGVVPLLHIHAIYPDTKVPFAGGVGPLAIIISPPAMEGINYW